MNATKLIFILAIGVMAMGCNCGSMTQTSTTLKTAEDTASFYIGYMYGSGLKDVGLKNPNVAAIVAGLNSALHVKDSTKNLQEMNMYLNQYMQKISMKKAEENAKKGAAFLTENAKKAGVDTLGSGIQYKVITEGTGAKPVATDIVRVHYKGTLIDGTEFDSSYKRGEPVEFELNRVIPGWTLALQHMPVGSKWIIYIPADMAYGERGGGLIEPNSTLIFEIELLDIVQPEAEQPVK